MMDVIRRYDINVMLTWSCEELYGRDDSDLLAFLSSALSFLSLEPPAIKPPTQKYQPTGSKKRYIIFFMVKILKAAFGSHPQEPIFLCFNLNSKPYINVTHYGNQQEHGITLSSTNNTVFIALTKRALSKQVSANFLTKL